MIFSKPYSFLMKLVIVISILGIAVPGVIQFHGFPRLFFQLILGAMYAHMIELQHELLHGLGIRSNKYNRLIGSLLGVFMLVSYSHYKFSHMKHHRFIGTSQNQEFFGANAKSINIKNFLPTLFMIYQHKTALILMLKSVYNKKIFREISNERFAKNIRYEYLCLMCFLSFMILISILTKRLWVIQFWFIPLCFASPIHALIELPEHYQCKLDSTLVSNNTRSITSHPLFSWFTNGNNFHVEHHYQPTMPIENLSLLHQKIKTQLVYYETTYWQFYKKFFAMLINKSNAKDLLR